MKAAKLRDMSEKELDKKLSDTRKELFNLRFQLAAGQLENTHRLGELRKEIARILTLREEKKLSPEEKKMVKEVSKGKKSEARSPKKEEIKKHVGEGFIPSRKKENVKETKVRKTASKPKKKQPKSEEKKPKKPVKKAEDK